MLRFYFDSSDQLELGNTEISQIENSVYKEVHEDMNLWYGGKLCFKDRLRQLHKIQLHIQSMQGYSTLWPIMPHAEYLQKRNNISFLLPEVDGRNRSSTTYIRSSCPPTSPSDDGSGHRVEIHLLIAGYVFDPLQDL